MLQQFTRTNPPSIDVQFSDGIAYSTDTMLAQWTGTMNHISLVANTDDLGGNGAPYAWLYSVDDKAISYYTTSDSTNVLATSGTWTSNVAGVTDATITITSSS